MSKTGNNKLTFLVIFKLTFLVKIILTILTFTYEKNYLIKLNDKGDASFHELIKEISEVYIAFL